LRLACRATGCKGQEQARGQKNASIHSVHQIKAAAKRPFGLS
jgi:hypothetical protein